MSNLTNTILSDLSVRVNALNLREETLKTELANVAGELSEARSLILTIKGSSVVKGYAPGATPGAPVKASSKYDAMTIRAAIRAYFTQNNNTPATAREIAGVIERKSGSVAAILSLSPEFVSTGGLPWNAGKWQAHPTWISNGWVTVGR